MAPVMPGIAYPATVVSPLVMGENTVLTRPWGREILPLTQLEGPSIMIHVIARIKAAEGQRQALLDAFAELVPTVLEEEGCVAYEPTIDAVTDIERQATRDDDVVTMVERWESVDLLKAHLGAPHMGAFRERNGHLIESAELRICETA